MAAPWKSGDSAQPAEPADLGTAPVDGVSEGGAWPPPNGQYGLTAASTTESAEPFVVSLSYLLGLAEETDDAVAVGTGVTLGLATESSEALAVAVPTPSDTSNRVGGRVRGSYGIAEWDPPVVPPPIGLDVGQVYEVLNTYGQASYPNADSQPVYPVKTAIKPRHLDRVVIGGKDVTWWRNAHTPTPDFQLIEPMTYGPATVTLPQAAVPFETPGKGALRFCRKGNPVVVQRVNTTTGEVVGTDYRGFVVSYRISGGELTLDVGGELSGRAALMNRQVPLFRTMADLGRWVYASVKTCGLELTPRLGPVTGIDVLKFGGLGHADYINQLCSMGTESDGTMWTLAATKKGSYRFSKKDTTTVDATVYFDDERLKPDLSQDLSEEPNRIYATGVTPKGLKIKFGVYPGLRQGPPAPYPFNDDRSFGPGTTNSDTDTGDGISAMLHKLVVSKYLDFENDSFPGGYDNDVSKAIKDLQADAGLNESGNMNPKTWRALYDLDATGFSLRWSHIEPAAQKSYTKRWHRSSSGAVSRKNPSYDPSRPKVDVNIDMGTGFTRGQLKQFAKGELRPDDNWVGTVAGRNALAKGLHLPGTNVEKSDVMSLREVRPGMNLWAPLFGPDGTLFHVSGASVSDGGRTVSLVLDTQFRDVLKVWQIIERNRESRTSPARAWLQEHRRSQMVNDSVITWDEIGGVIDSSIKVPAQTWFVFEVLAGQEGTIQRLKARTSPNAQFAMAVFGNRIRPGKLQRLVGDPLTEEGSARWQDAAVLERLDRENVMIYIAGNDESPCGYYPYTKDDGAGLTGRWEDDAGIPFRTFKHPVLWVAVWADRATSIPAGRIFWPQMEEGT